MTRREFLQSLVRSPAQRAADYIRWSWDAKVPVMTDAELERTFGVGVDNIVAEMLKNGMLP